jgi:RNA polymerase sigma-70 factor (ECF subfamily)
VAANHCLNEIRRGEYAARDREDREGPPDPDRVASPDADPEQAARGAALERTVGALLESLPEKQRLAFVLCRFEGQSYEEIARVLETSVPAVKSLVHRATVAAAAALAPEREARKEALP